MFCVMVHRSSRPRAKTQPVPYKNVSIPMLAVSVKVCAGIVACTSGPDCG